MARLLDEDPEGWRRLDGLLWHPLGYRIESGSRGPETLNGYALGWWGRFVLRRAVWRRDGVLVDRYLEKARTARLAAEEAEADRLLGG